MSFLDWFTGKIDCPRCGTGGAKEINGSIHCPNPTCSYFSKTMGKGDATQASAPPTFRQAEAVPAGYSPQQPEEVRPGYFAIHYRNFGGQEKTFVAEAASAYRARNHIIVKVLPRKTGIVLSRDRILNLNDVEAAFPQRVQPGQAWPTPRERQVMTYHKKRRSASRLYETIRAKYPNW